MFDVPGWGGWIAVYVRTTCTCGDENLQHVEGRELHLRCDDLGKIHP